MIIIPTSSSSTATARSLPLFAELFVVLLLLPSRTTSFTRISKIPSVSSAKAFYRQGQYLSSSRKDDSWDSEEDYVEFNKRMGDGPPEDGVEWTDFLGPGGKLGIDIGKELMNLTREEADELKREGTEIIERAFASKLKEMETLQDNLRKDFEESKMDMIDASNARASLETERLMNKIDKLTENFLKESEQSRASTKLAAAADQNMAGRGLEFGSWGTDSSGREVVTLGEKGSSFFIEETLGDTLPSSNTPTKILLVVDESKSKEDAKLAQLVVEAFKEVPNTYCHTVTPFRVPTGGGEDCKVAILFSSCINDRSDFESLLDRLLKRTISSFPPTHLVLVSSLGTTRANKLPYNIQNLVGRKLDKKREIEEAIISRSRMGLSGGLKPIDYTVIKFGELKSGSKKQREASNEKSTSAVHVAYGDALDGGIEYDDAVQVLFQSITLQKAARNCTFSAVSDPAAEVAMENKSRSQEEWDDLFLRLDGPELLRVEIKKPGDDDANYKLLCEYILGWAQLFEENNGKEMGLSTPVAVMRSKQSPGCVQLEFKATKTGAAYKSSKEEKIMESERKKYIKSSDGNSNNKLEGGGSKVKVKKEGGVEVLVEHEPVLRVRAKRCNMGYDTVVKEMSEEIILKKLRDAIKFWVEQ